MTEEKKVSRRGYVKYAGAGIVVVAGAAAGAYYATKPPPAATTTAATTSATSTKTYGGEVHGLYVSTSYFDALKPYLDGFAEKWGPKATYEEYGYMDFDKKLRMDYTAKTGIYDVAMVVSVFRSTFIDQMHAFMSLEDLDKEGLAPDIPFDRTDFPPGVVNMLWPYVLPAMAAIQILAYDPEAYNKYGVDSPPNDYYELIETAKKMYDPPNSYGWGEPAAHSDEISTSWDHILLAIGGKHFEYDTMTPLFDSDKAVEAAKILIELTKLSPPEATTWDVMGAVNALVQGYVKQYFLWSSLGGYAEDPNSSKMVGKLSYYGFPALEGGWGINVSAYSKNPETAYLLLKYIMTKDVAIGMQRAGGSPFNLSAMDDPVAQAKYPWLKAQSDAYHNPERLLMMQSYPQITDVGVIEMDALHRACIGDLTAEQACAEMQQKVSELMKGTS